MNNLHYCFVCDIIVTRKEVGLNIYQKISTAVALCLYLPLSYQILKGQVKQNFATWILWGLLDGVVAASLYAQSGNWHLPAAYVCGCTLVLVCMFRATTFEWSNFETFICVLVGMCIVGWYFSGPWMATVLASISMALATLPQIKQAFDSPEEMPLGTYVGYVFVNVMSTIGGKNWSVEERLYSGICAVLTIVIVICALQRYLPSFKPRSA